MSSPMQAAEPPRRARAVRWRWPRPRCGARRRRLRATSRRFADRPEGRDRRRLRSRRRRIHARAARRTRTTARRTWRSTAPSCAPRRCTSPAARRLAAHRQARRGADRVPDGARAEPGERRHRGRAAPDAGRSCGTRSPCRPTARRSSRRWSIARATCRTRRLRAAARRRSCRPRCVFREASSRDVFTTLARFANLNVVFDPAFRDRRSRSTCATSTFEDALTSITSSTRTFYRVTAPRTITIVPDTPAKRREYEDEIVRTFYLSNADLKETIDLLRIVVDVRRIAGVPATNAITIKDTPERLAAAGAHHLGDRQGAARSRDRRRAARGRSQAPAGVRPADRLAGVVPASTAASTSTRQGLTLDDLRT